MEKKSPYGLPGINVEIGIRVISFIVTEPILCFIHYEIKFGLMVCDQAQSRMILLFLKTYKKFPKAPQETDLFKLIFQKA